LGNVVALGLLLLKKPPLRNLLNPLHLHIPAHRLKSMIVLANVVEKNLHPEIPKVS
jgi:hypothetical protein